MIFFAFNLFSGRKIDHNPDVMPATVQTQQNLSAGWTTPAG
jgi:hypothetical protein